MSEGWLEAIPNPGRWADAILVVHALIVCFVIGGLVAIVLGGWRRWAWTRNVFFRLTHLVTIAFVVAQAWLGRLCPLTVWEQDLRLAAGQGIFERSFIERWVAELLYWNLPWWVFLTVYTLFGVAVAWSWWRFPPAWSRSGLKRE